MAQGFSADQQRVIGKDRVIVHGKFRPDGSSGIVSGSSEGIGWTAARTSVGLYTVTLAKPMPQLISCTAGVRDADAVGIMAVAGDYSASAGTLQIRVMHGPRGFIPLDIANAREIFSDVTTNIAANGGILASDTTPILERVNGATDKALRLNWAASNVDEVQFAPVPIPPAMNGANDVTVHLWAGMGGATNTPVMTVAAFEGVGDTNMGGNTAALAATAGERTVTLTAANVAGHPGFLNISVLPGAHGTDAAYLYAAWIEYVTLIDLAADVDNEVSFSLNFRNNPGNY